MTKKITFKQLLKNKPTNKLLLAEQAAEQAAAEQAAAEQAAAEQAAAEQAAAEQAAAEQAAAEQAAAEQAAPLQAALKAEQAADVDGVEDEASYFKKVLTGEIEMTEKDEEKIYSKVGG